MRWFRRVFLVVTLATLVGGCAIDNREWMKLSGRYTTEDFRRDRAACMKKGDLDEVCMRERGWVAVSPGGKAETSKDPLARDLQPPSGREGRRY
jgi:hypothetical protein